MELTDEQLQKIIDTITGYIPNGLSCPVCGKSHWNLSNLVMEVKEYEKDENLIGEKRVTPFITLTCKNCSNTLFFNAIRLGIIEKDSNKKDNTDTSKE